MIIQSIEAIPLCYNMEQAIWDAQHYFQTRQCLLIKIKTSEGIIGFGESATFGGPVNVTKVVVEEELAPFYIGKDPFHVEELWESAYLSTIQHGRRGIVIAAISGIDIAVWDIIGKACKQPLYRVLGAHKNSVQAYASGGFYAEGKENNSLCDEIVSAVERGFTTAKIKVGKMPLQVDIERLRSVRKAVGDGVRLAVDANSNWDVPTAEKAAILFEELDVDWIEEPVSVDDVSGSAQVARNSAIAISGYEQETSLFGYKQLIEARAIDVIQPDVVWCGGITAARRIAALAAAHSIPCRPHVFSSGLCLSANLHFIASTSNADLLEYDQNPNPLRNELIMGRLLPDSQGVVKMPSDPGLGVEVDDDILKKYRI